MSGGSFGTPWTCGRRKGSMGRSDKGFYARFLGGFSLYYNEEELQLGASLQNISTQIVLMLLKAGGDGIEKKELMALIRPEEHEWAKRLNNFRQQIHILRRRIERVGFPAGEYVVSVGTRYYFSLEQRVETDTAYLDRLVEQIKACRTGADQAGRKGLHLLYLEYYRAYKGEFLPTLGGEAWVAMESAFYQKWYFICLDALCQELKSAGKYAVMLELCTTASQIHPYDEWQAAQIECLLAMDRYREALEIYEKATEIFYKDLGVTSLDRAMERYRGAEKATSYMAGALKRLKKDLEEDELMDGPYLCSYPSFQDICRIMARVGERDGTKNQLLLCTILADAAGGEAAGGGAAAKDGARAKEKDGQPYREWGGEKTGHKMELLQEILVDKLRTGDAYTRYSQNQFLVLLAGADTLAGQRIVRRLENDWKLYNQDRWAKVRFALEGTEGLSAEGSRHEEEENIRCTYHRPGRSYLAGAGDLAGREGDQKLQEPAGKDQIDGWGRG